MDQAMMERELEKARRDAEDFRTAWQDERKKSAQASAEAAHWKKQVECVALSAQESFEKLNALYRKAIGDAARMITNHPAAGKCRDCDFNALAKRVLALRPTEISGPPPRRARP